MLTSTVLVLALVLGAGWRIHATTLHRLLGTWRIDQVTGLPVRQAFYNEAPSALRRPGSVIVLLDLDDFKRLNDVYGHIPGDHALRTIAGRLRDFFGPHAVLCRLGGDEFAVVAQLGPATGRWQVALRRLPAKLAAPIDLPGGANATVRASIGALHLNDAEHPNLSSALHMADDLAYRAKSTVEGLVVMALEPGDTAVTQPVDEHPHHRVRHGPNSETGCGASHPHVTQLLRDTR